MARTTAELKEVLRQYRAAKSGDGPKVVKTGFGTGKDVSPKDLNPKQKSMRGDLRSRIKSIKQDLKAEGTLPQTDRQRKRQNIVGGMGNPQTSDKPPVRFPGPPLKPSQNTGETPPTKPGVAGKVGPSYKPTGVSPAKEQMLRKRLTK